jgi:hypothetical protein
MIRGHCNAHPTAKLQCPVCLGGSRKGKSTEAQNKARRLNAKLGGRVAKWKEAS